MGVRSILANAAFDTGVAIARAFGTEIAVDVSEHSIDARMMVPSTSERAWDDSLYQSGQVFVDGYANPIKPVPRRTEDREELDEVEDDTGFSKLVASNKYQSYQDQHLISEMAQPEEQWTKVLYAAGAAAIIALINLVLGVVSLSALGVF